MFAGKYVRSSYSDNYKSFMSNFGIPADKADAMLKGDVETEVTDLGGGKYRDVTKMPGRTIDKTFELGKRFEDVGPDGKHSTNIVTKTADDTWVVDVERKGETRRLKITKKFSAAGVETVLECNGDKATVTMKRV